MLTLDHGNSPPSFFLSCHFNSFHSIPFHVIPFGSISCHFLGLLLSHLYNYLLISLCVHSSIRSFFHFSGSLFPDLLTASTRDLGRRPLASSSLWNGFLLSESLAPTLLWSSKRWEPVCRLGKLQRQLIGHFQVAFLRSANMFIFIQIDSFHMKLARRLILK